MYDKIHYKKKKKKNEEESEWIYASHHGARHIAVLKNRVSTFDEKKFIKEWLLISLLISKVDEAAHM